jgi:hypothetical protein
MVATPEDYIPRLDIELERLLTRMQERYELAVREIEHMAGCLAPKTL